MLSLKDTRKGRFWVIGGTQESVVVVEKIVQSGFPCTVTVTTSTALALYCENSLLRCLAGKILASEMGAFLKEEEIVGIVDASHPYAVNVSQGAIALSRQYNLPYLRYERASIPSLPSKTIRELKNWETLLKGDYLRGQRVLLTVGYKSLPLFQSWQDRCTLFARILPSVASLETSLEAGFTPDRLICLRPPISAELEKALWQQWDISCVVTKASGKAGGENVKREVAEALGIPLIVIQRPSVDYPQQTSNVQDVVEFCQKNWD